MLQAWWPIPVDTDAAFEAACTDLAGRIDRLAPAADVVVEHAASEPARAH
jgi:hypothetical protein